MLEHHNPKHMEPSRVFWLGRHAAQPAWGAPVSKVHREGLQLLKSLDWQQVPNDTPKLPIFAFTTRNGANYPADQPGLPPVRQLPHQHSACLDDKRAMQQHLQPAGQGRLMPPCWPCLDDYWGWLQDCAGMDVDLNQQQQHQGKQQEEEEEEETQLGCALATGPTGHSASSGQTASMPDPTSSTNSSAQRLPATVFVKHRRGVKGQAVYVAHTLADLQQLRQRVKGSAADFVVQQEAGPPLLLVGRKFVLRAHVLVVLRQQQQRGGQQHREQHKQQQQQQQEQGTAKGTGQGKAAPVASQQVQGSGPAAAAVASTPLGGSKDQQQQQHERHKQQQQQQVQDCGPAAAAAAVVASTPLGGREDSSTPAARPALQLYLHEDVILLPHAAAYGPASRDPAVHISSKGRQHPAPLLLRQRPALHAGVWPQLLALSAAAVGAVADALVPPAVCPGVLLYQLLRFDCMVIDADVDDSSAGAGGGVAGCQVLLLANSYPAIASGTMSGVDVGVYTRLVGDLVLLLVPPVLTRLEGTAAGAAEPAPPGGFVLCAGGCGG